LRTFRIQRWLRKPGGFPVSRKPNTIAIHCGESHWRGTSLSRLLSNPNCCREVPEQPVQIEAMRLAARRLVAGWQARVS
jgi:hypothetical protein